MLVFAAGASAVGQAKLGSSNQRDWNDTAAGLIPDEKNDRAGRRALAGLTMLPSTLRTPAPLPELRDSPGVRAFKSTNRLSVMFTVQPGGGGSSRQTPRPVSMAVARRQRLARRLRPVPGEKGRPWFHQ